MTKAFCRDSRAFGLSETVGNRSNRLNCRSRFRHKGRRFYRIELYITAFAIENIRAFCSVDIRICSNRNIDRAGSCTAANGDIGRTVDIGDSRVAGNFDFTGSGRFGRSFTDQGRSGSAEFGVTADFYLGVICYGNGSVHRGFGRVIIRIGFFRSTDGRIAAGRVLGKTVGADCGNFGIILYCDCSAGKGAVPSTADSGGCGTSGGSNLSIAADDNIPVIISFFSAADAGTTPGGICVDFCISINGNRAGKIAFFAGTDSCRAGIGRIIVFSCCGDCYIIGDVDRTGKIFFSLSGVAAVSIGADFCAVGPAG